jgi:hypothetical protein
MQNGHIVTNVKREVLKLYRDVWRMTCCFDFPNEHGELWRDVLRRSARQEFEMARHIHDQEEIFSRIITGYEALAKLQLHVSEVLPL